MVWTPARRETGYRHREEVPTLAVKVIGLDTAKHVFQVHGADLSGRAVLRKRLRRSQVSLATFRSL